jgi:Fic family protein
MWIHECSDWPKFKWDAEALTSKLASLRHKQGRLLGRMESLGFDLRREASLNTLTKDVVYSSAIEGEDLNKDEVRSSIARHLGVDIGGLLPKNRNVEGIVEMMLDATQGFFKPLTADRLFNWHASLFPTGRSGVQWITVAGWRAAESGPMQVVSGYHGRERVHFEAPHAHKLEVEMSCFLNWFECESDIDPVLKAGIAHLWFVTIHPFEDGNGRIARAIGDMALARADHTADRFYSLSSQIESERKDYYKELEYQQRGTLDITKWLQWFMACMDRAIDNAEGGLNRTLFKAKLWDKLNQHNINDRQKLVINRMLELRFEGHMNTSKYAKLTKCSPDTALRDISFLKNLGILIQNEGGGRSTSYRLIESL